MRTQVVFASPSHLATSAGIAFDTYRFYLECICQSLLDAHGDLGAFVASAAGHASSIAKKPALDQAIVQRHLKIAWNTEFLLSLDHADPLITRINNQWAPIQAYYAVYSALEALAYAIDGSQANSHQKALSKCSSWLVSFGLSPWDKAYQGCLGKSGSSHLPQNFPPNMNVPSNLQRSQVAPLEMLARCLKAEHSHRVDDKWQSKKRSGCYKYMYDPGPTTLLHFLYRLRIMSNYEEIDIFVTDAPEANVLQFAESLRTITSWSLCLVETVLAARLAKDSLIQQAKDYLSINPKALSLGERVGNYQALAV